MPARHLWQLQRYWSEEPWGPWRDNMHAGLVASMLGNIHRKKGARPKGPEAYMLKRADVAKSDSLASTFAALKAQARKVGRGKT